MRFRFFVLFVTVACGTGLILGQSAPAKKTASKKALAAKSKSPSHGKTPVRRAASPPRQASPTPDRYKEIQNALVAKGYLKSEPTGVWDAASVDAMKRYQSDQKQDPTGKLTAASIISLGLGPHTASTGATP